MTCNLKAILVSACLVGDNCRWDGTNKRCEELIQILDKEQINAIAVCPEQEGGLPTPRPPSKFVMGDGNSVLRGESKLLNSNNCDVTVEFILGAHKSLNKAIEAGVICAVFRDKSPSCGVNYIYRGETLAMGHGVTCALLKKHNIKVFSELELKEFLAFIKK